MSSGHTPGPWEARDRNASGRPERRGIGGWDIRQNNDRNLPSGIAYLQSHPMLSRERGEANAMLIAASPDMLEALKVADDALAQMSCDRVPYAVRRQVLDAIAKAEGKS